MRARILAALGGLAAVALAGCGSSAAPSSLDPAQIAPAKSVVYLELTVRPQGSTRSEAESGLTRLLGHSPDADIQRLVGRLFQHSGLSYSNDLEPWLGQRVGIVATALSRAGLGLIAPTDDPSAALAALKRAEKNAGLRATTYRGVPYQTGVDNGTPVAAGIVSRSYAVLASPTTFDAIVDASKGDSLRTQSPFVSSFLPLPTSAVARAYANGPAVVSALAALPTMSSATRQQLQTLIAHGKVPSAVTLALSVSSKSIGAEFRSSSVSAIVHHSTADVAGLPGESWLALSTGTGASKALTNSITSAFTRSFNRAALVQGLNPATLLGALQRRIGINVERDLLPALGGLQFAIGGTSPLTLGAGLALHPSDPQAAARLVSEIRNLVARSHSLQVSGGREAFTITRSGLPIPKIVVADTGPEVLATFDLPSFQSFLAPATTLATNPTFQRARGALLAGSNVPLFVDFGALSALANALPQLAAQPRDAKVLAVLRRLDFLVFGFNQAARDVQLVLGLR